MDLVCTNCGGAIPPTDLPGKYEPLRVGSHPLCHTCWLAWHDLIFAIEPPFPYRWSRRWINEDLRLPRPKDSEDW